MTKPQTQGHLRFTHALFVTYEHREFYLLTDFT